MGGIFPFQNDGGLPSNPAQPNNPAQAFAPTLPPLDTSALYYGNGCDVRLRPHVVNSIISEIAATADRAGFGYQASSLHNLENAIRYMIQRGIPRGAPLIEQSPFYYAAVLDPPATAYNDFMTLSLVPVMSVGDTQNQGYVRIRANNLGYVPLLRNDGQELRAGDLAPGIPFLCVYYQGAFYYAGLVDSQVPLVLVGAVNFWIRPDGNDATGDGTANTPDKAFRTIDGCWYAVGSRYAGSPTAAIVMRLGVPGDYQGGDVGPYGATVIVQGDVNNASAYRILSKTSGTPPNAAWSLRATQVNNFALNGVNLVMTYPGVTANGVACLSLQGGQNIFTNCVFSIEVNNAGGYVVILQGGGAAAAIGDTYVHGNGHTIYCGLDVNQAAQIPGVAAPSSATWRWDNINFSGMGYSVGDRSALGHINTSVISTNTTGQRYYVFASSVLYSLGQTPPGSTAGVVASQGQVL